MALSSQVSPRKMEARSGCTARARKNKVTARARVQRSCILLPLIRRHTTETGSLQSFDPEPKAGRKQGGRYRFNHKAGRFQAETSERGKGPASGLGVRIQRIFCQVSSATM